MRRGIVVLVSLVIIALLLVGPAAARYLSYYRLNSQEEVAPPPDYNPLDVVALVPTPPANEFVDEPSAEGGGLILLDEAHANNFTLDEIDYLDARLAARGFELVSFRGGDLRSALRPVSAFITITPISAFDRDEIVTIADFVERGGRLLMVGDPTRFSVSFVETDFDFTFQLDTDRIPLNSLANEFDLEFNGDYLYNTVENEGNFRNILLQDEAFAANGLSNGLETLAFYGAHSVQVGSGAEAILTADDNTWSSATDRPGGLVLAALGGDGNVLAVGDMDFLADPYRTVYDNSRFIARIADFLTESEERSLALSDFPFFYGSQVDLVYTGTPDLGPDAFDEVIALQDAFRRAGINLSLAAEADGDNDALYLGLYNQSEEVAALLEAAGITLVIDPAIVEEEESEESEEEAPAEEEELTEEPPADDEEAEVTRQIQSALGNAQMSGTALIVLSEEDGQRQVIVLAASNDGLENTVGRLLDLMPIDGDYALADCLVQGQLALCPTNVSDEDVEAKLETGGVPDTTIGGGGNGGNGGNGGGGGEGTTDQGDISLGDSVEGSLDEEEAHSWTFSDGPATVDIILTGSDDVDGVLELYDPDDELVETADSTFSGGEEILAAVTLDEGTYTIIVRDFFDDGGDYTLEVREAEEIVPEPIEADDQGEIGLDEEVSGTLDPEQAHSWTFVSEGEAVIDITLVCGEELDGVLAVYDEDGNLIDEIDAGLTGEEEVLAGIGVAEGSYTIVVSDYFEDGGSYSLIVQTGSDDGSGAIGGNGIFIFEDDDGVALAGGFTSVEPLTAYLLPTHEVTVWNVTDDGPLEEGQLNGYDLVIWDSGDYRDEENAFDTNTLIIFDYLSQGGKVLVTGLVPSIFEPAELAPISDIEFVGDEATLLDGFESGDVIELDDTYEGAILDPEDSDLEETDLAFITRGPQSEPAEAYIGLASASTDFSGGRLVLLAVPFVTLPEDTQQTLLANMLNWLGV
jgi:hypothetical protein